MMADGDRLAAYQTNAYWSDIGTVGDLLRANLDCVSGALGLGAGEGIDETAIHWGPGHWPGSALPGQRGNTVFAGHRVTHTRPFLDIDLLVPGDQIILHLATGTYTYQVTDHIIVNPEETWIANPTADPTVTIFGCHPKHSAAHRYVVRGKLVATGPFSPV